MEGRITQENPKTQKRHQKEGKPCANKNCRMSSHKITNDSSQVGSAQMAEYLDPEALDEKVLV